MDDCPVCGVPSPIWSTSMNSETSIHICWDCHLSWTPPRNDKGRKRARAYPADTVVSAAS